jgi:hypothetical protein
MKVEADETSLCLSLVLSLIGIHRLDERFQQV